MTEENEYIKEDIDSLPFKDAFPEKGDGKVRDSNRRRGEGQTGAGRISTKEKVECRFCRFRVDKNRFSHEGGSEDGNGGNYMDGSEPKTKAGKGCPNCGSLNYSK